MAKVRPISGFPEWLPEERLVEQQVLDLTIEEPPIEDVIELVFAQEL